MARIVINQEKCKGCLLCIESCPKKMIEPCNKINSKGCYPVRFLEEKKECTGCALCATRCPDIAIEVYR
jgi:2-oxoglutarate ferredoxin oxidoreductase subunit delta